MSRDSDTIAVLVFDGAPLFETSVPLSVFGFDRTASGAPAFTTLAIAADPGPSTSTAGVTLQAPHDLDAMDRAGVVVIPAWGDIATAPSDAVVDAIRRAHAEGALIVSLCLGAFVLCATGLVDGRTVATNWYAADELQRRFPAVHVDPSVLFVDHGDVVAGAGTSAAVDTCLHVVRQRWGAQAATTIARRMVVAPVRSGGQAQFIDRPIPPVGGDDPVARTLEHIQMHLQDDLDVDALARRVHLSRRTFDRRFRAQTGVSPLQWILRQRILHAQHLLEHSDLPVDLVAQRSGMGSAVTLRPHFRAVVGVSPQRYRETFRLREATR